MPNFANSPIASVSQQPVDFRPASARRRILDAARDLIRLHGYERFSMEAVAARSGLTRRTIYNQFEDREALYRASRLELLADVEAVLPFEVARGNDVSGPMQRFFAAAMEALAMPEHQELHDSVKRDGHAVPWLRELYTNRIDRQLRLAVEHFLLTRQAAGAIKIDDAETHARQCLAMIKAATAGPTDVPAFDSRELALIMIGRLENPVGSSASPH